MEQESRASVLLDARRLSVEIRRLFIEDEEIYRALSQLPEESLPDRVRRALKVGLIALRDAETVSKVDYVESSFQDMRREMESSLERHLGEEGSLIIRHLNPSDEESILGRFRKRIEDLIDANRDGSPFADIKKTLQGEFKELHAKLESRRAVKEEREKGTQKGLDFEGFVYETLLGLAGPLDDRVEPIGTRPGPLGDVGDVLITLNPAHTGGREVRVVVEVKNRGISLRGKNSIFEEVERARENRGAHYSMIVVRAKEAPTEIGALRIDPKGAIICTIEEDGDHLALEVAYKLARAEAIRISSEGEGQFDPQQIIAALEKVRSKLEMIKGMKSSLSGAERSLRQVKDDLDLFRDGVREILDRVTASSLASHPAHPAA
ncbi:MAG: hypothetical protein O7H41_05800 [Planctomycetota bacterium]|nr:hypothetical protein [Planctomycetota bacterium]